MYVLGTAFVKHYEQYEVCLLLYHEENICLIFFLLVSLEIQFDYGEQREYSMWRRDEVGSMKISTWILPRCIGIFIIV